MKSEPNKIPWLLALLLLTSCNASKQSTVIDNTFIPDPVSVNGKSLLYQIYGLGLSQPSYLFGTIHIMNNDDFAIGKNVEKKLKSASKLVMELDLGEADLADLAAKSLFPEGKSIQDYISEEDYDTLKTFFADSIGVDPMVFEMAYAKMKPIFMEQLIYFKYVGENPSSYENSFTEIAENKEIAIVGLETFNEQLALLNEFPLEEQIQHLLHTVKHYSQESKNMDTLFDFYINQDIEGIFQFATSSEDISDEFEETLIYKRNKKWIPKITDLISQNSSFIAVGAGHLGGPQGLIKLLKDKGYTVEPINTEK
jgi:uncharacterized protein YbaP (TraB family)